MTLSSKVQTATAAASRTLDHGKSPRTNKK
jgi:hypothetical protein